jgi:Ca2+-transporting ATPase
LGAFALAFRYLDLVQDRAVTLSSLALAFAWLWHLFDVRDSETGLACNDVSVLAVVAQNVRD